MRISVAAYPWDVARLSPAAVLGELAGLGVDLLDLSATYHPIDAMSPRGDPVWVFALDRGAVFFPADTSRYRVIEPSVWPDSTVPQVWNQLVELGPSYGVEIRPWVIALFQPWIADRYPACRQVLANGQAVAGSVCPSSDEVRAYTAELCCDVMDQTGAGSLRLEAVSHPELTHQWSRPRYLVHLSPEARQLLSLCFCAGCAGSAAAAGIDVTALRRHVCEQIRAELADAKPRRSARSAPDPYMDGQLTSFVGSARRKSEELVETVVSALRSSGKSRQVLLTTTPRDTTSPLDPFPVEALAGLVDGFMVHPRRNPEMARFLAARRAETDTPLYLSAFVMAGSDGAGGLRGQQGDHHPDEALTADLSEAGGMSVNEIAIYNFGLVDAATLRSTVELARQASA